MTLHAQNFVGPDTRARDAEFVMMRLDQAGRALLALPRSGPSTRLVQGGLDWIRDAAEVSAPSRGRIRPAVPDAATISRMDEALAWIPLIPVDRYVLRRVVGARCLVNPLTDRHLYTWRRLGLAVGADHKAVQRWHAQGIDLIVAALSRPAGARDRRAAGGQRALPRGHAEIRTAREVWVDGDGLS